MSAGDLVERVAATGLLPVGVPVVVGVSAGRDSLCLLHLAARLVGPDAVLAVHVHHGLRGASADGDARAAVAAARGMGVAVRVARLGVPSAVRASSASPAVWARNARKAALRAAADAWGGAGCAVVVAHTASDQAETVLLRAISSPGARSLAGIAVRDEARGVVRPLLAAGVTRAETGEWCTGHGLAWRDDPTNATGARGRVRTLLEGLEALDGRAVRALVLTADRAREDDAALRLAAAALVGDGPDVAREALVAAPVAVARRALRLVAEAAVGRSCPRVGGRLEDVLALRPRGGASAAVDLGDGVRAVLRAGRVGCAPSPPRS